MLSLKRQPIIIALVISASLGVLFWFSVFGVWREKLTDLLFTTRKPPADIVIIAIDDDSITAIGQWPWPRAVFADAIRKLQSAKVIAIDVNFKEPSSRGSADDVVLADSLNASRPPVILSDQIEADGTVKYPLELFRSRTLPGFTNITASSDNIIRRLTLSRAGMDSFAHQIAKSYGITDANPLTNTNLINYYGRNGSFSRISFKDALSNKIPESFIKDKIVIIGATAPDLHDFHETPFGIISGAEIQANIVQTILDGRFFRSDRRVDLLAVFILALLTAWLSFRIKKFSRLIAGAAAVLVGYNLAAFLSFDGFFVFDLLYPNLAIILTTGLSVSWQYVITLKEKKFIRDSFGYYLAPEVIEELIKNPDKLKLGGERKRITVLFSDIRRFTAISEKMAPESLTRFLNRYLTTMSNIILANQGVIDKYIGDAIMAFWGAPLENPNQSLDAMLAAYKMVNELETVNRENRLNNHPEIDNGIGIHVGNVTVGNLGSDKRFDYTVIGDSVNLASRLEGLNKVYGTNIIVSQEVADAVTEQEKARYGLTLREIDRVKVKGKATPVTIYQLAGEKDKEKIAAIARDFETGLANYYRGEWTKAVEIFSEILKRVPDDGPSRCLLERSEKLRDANIADWNGVYEMQDK